VLPVRRYFSAIEEKSCTVVVAALAADDEDREVVGLEALRLRDVEPADHLPLDRAERLRQRVNADAQTAWSCTRCLRGVLPLLLALCRACCMLHRMGKPRTNTLCGSAGVSRSPSDQERRGQAVGTRVKSRPAC